jgi:hypothetical protein
MAGDVQAEARRLLALYAQDAERLHQVGLAGDWRAQMESALGGSGPEELRDFAALTLMEQFVLRANAAYSKAEARAKGVNIRGPGAPQLSDRVIVRPIAADAAPVDSRDDRASESQVKAATTSEPSPGAAQSSSKPSNSVPMLDRAAEGIADTFAGALQDMGEQRSGSAPSYFSASIPGESGKVKWKPGEEKHETPEQIDGFDAKNVKKVKVGCEGAADVECDPWQWDVATQVIKKNVQKIEYEYQTKDVGDHAVRVRIWKVITSSHIEHFWTIHYQVCCCRWFWGAFRFPGDCWSYYEIHEEGDKTVTDAKDKQLVVDDLYTDWTAQLTQWLKELIDNAAKGAGTAAGGAAGGAAKELVDPVAKKIGEEIKKKLGLPDDTKSGSGGSGSGAGGGATPPK